MSEHLPECQRFFTDMPAPDECPACGMFRACEQRILGLNPVAHDVLIAQRARERALDAAREAVEKLAKDTWCDSAPCWGAERFLAAIDALREVEK